MYWWMLIRINLFSCVTAGKILYLTHGLKFTQTNWAKVATSVLLCILCRFYYSRCPERSRVRECNFSGSTISKVYVPLSLSVGSTISKVAIAGLPPILILSDAAILESLEDQKEQMNAKDPLISVHHWENDKTNTITCMLLTCNN